MKGELAQAAALVSYGNRWLRSEGTTPFDWQKHSAFQYVHEFSFVQVTRRFIVLPTSQVVARDPMEWLAWVARNRASRLILVISTDLDWLVCTSDLSLRMWRPHLKARLFPGNGKPWNQLYVAGHDESADKHPLKDVATASDDLKRALESIISFARRAGLEEWVTRFGSARSILEREGDAPIPYYPDLIASNDHEVRRLAAASVAGSMFSGAGSWNDVAPDIQRRDDYRAVTEATYSAVLDGIAAAASWPTA